MSDGIGKGIVSVLRRLGRAWDVIEMAIGGLFLTAAVVIVMTEVINRTFLMRSTMGAAEIASYAVIWSVLFTASIAVKNNAHVRIDILLNIVPQKAGRILDAIGVLFALAFTLYLTYSGWVLVEESRMLGEVSMTSLRTPLWIPQLIMPIGGFLLSVRLFQRFIMILRSPAILATQGQNHGLA